MLVRPHENVFAYHAPGRPRYWEDRGSCSRGAYLPVADHFPDDVVPPTSHLLPVTPLSSPQPHRTSGSFVCLFFCFFCVCFFTCPAKEMPHHTLSPTVSPLYNTSLPSPSGSFLPGCPASGHSSGSFAHHLPTHSHPFRR